MNKTFFKNQKDMSAKLIEIIDLYWEGKVNEFDFFNNINTLVDNNIDIIFKDDNYRAVITQRLGKKRICLLNKVLNFRNEAK
ncbi:MAG: TIGR04540 family protein [Paraclostridium sordellii]|uniref:TIGR04540 family protein n=1 Tax=Paraclostridium sordellii TaxID=1505 RepID=UPI0030D5766F